MVSAARITMNVMTMTIFRGLKMSVIHDLVAGQLKYRKFLYNSNFCMPHRSIELKICTYALTWF